MYQILQPHQAAREEQGEGRREDERGGVEEGRKKGAMGETEVISSNRIQKHLTSGNRCNKLELPSI